MDTTLSLIRQFPETKSQIQLFASKTIDMIKEGCEDPIDLSIRLKALEETIRQIRAGIKDIALEEAEKNGKEFDYNNAKIQIAMVGVSYDFSNCNHTEWNELTAKEKEIKNKKAEIEKDLKNIKGQRTELNEDTGEVITYFEPLKKGAESIKISLK